MASERDDRRSSAPSYPISSSPPEWSPRHTAEWRLPTRTRTERLLDALARGRAALGVALALVITIAVLVTYQLGGMGGASSVAAGRSTTTTTTEPVATTDPPDSLATVTTRELERAVDDRVGEVPIDEEGPGDGTTPTTTPEADVAPAETVAETGPADETPTTDGDAATTTTAAEASTTIPSSTSEVPPTSEGVTTTIPEGSTTTTNPPAPIRVEAETGSLLGAARARSDHQGFSGSGFVGDLISEGSGVELVVDVPVGGPTSFTVAYAAGPENGPPDLRTVTVLVNGIHATEARMQLTASWDHWDVVTGTLDLPQGQTVITLLWQQGDTGWVSIDYIEIG